jgi:hypothetical protein
MLPSSPWLYRSRVLTPPPELSEDVLTSTLADGWAVPVTSMVYRPVGFGSHHWNVTGAAGTRWFVTVDDLAKRRRSRGEPADVAFERLHASLAAARHLRDAGRTFVVAPVPARDGAPLVRVDGRFAVALYPFVDGRSFAWGGFDPYAHRRAVLDLVIEVHASAGSPATSRPGPS